MDVLDKATRGLAMEKQQKIMDERKTRGKQYAAQFKTKMLDVLTDEQWLRLQNMIDNPSGLVKMMLEKTKAWRKKKEAWAPGPNSWRPGDPIPEGYRQQRQERGRFPRPTDNQSP